MTDDERDGYYGYLEYLRVMRLRGIRSGELTPMNDEEARDAERDTV